MKKLLFAMSVLALSLSASPAIAQRPQPGHRQAFSQNAAQRQRPVGNFLPSRPAKSIDVNYYGSHLWYYEGVYYKERGPARYEVVRPPKGMLVPKLYRPSSFRYRGEKLYLSKGVVYRRIKTPRGKMYEVVGFR